MAVPFFHARRHAWRHNARGMAPPGWHTHAARLCYTRRTMNLVKSLLLWLLLAALPLQGYAAASTFMANTMQDEKAPARMAAPCHHAAASQQLTPPGHCAMQTQTQTHHAHCGAGAHQAKCGNCAACCVGAAIALPALALADVWPVGSEAIAYRVRHVTAHIPGGLERPPHTRLA
ncbi:hypothetical protein [Rugamonas apoptosis]|uniref:Uncharacterized protein n=1 Tax=Rugamonas apoptosis TaxID=2758570 RepID=A0A7W2F9K1_9BURK|nr:hypothetical protein [Rugamonas apoptosis]MBA5687590.1 hypothetical protein [Rugamonas apoptosis]